MMSHPSTALHEILTPEQLTTHLETTYNIKIHKTTSLDHNVHRIDHGDPNTPTSWIARIFPQPSALTSLTQLSKLLQYLKSQNFPCESHPVSNPISTLSSPPSQTLVSIFITTFIPGHRPARNKVTYYRLGKLLGRLHSLPVPETFTDLVVGGWHHLVFPGDKICEITSAIDLVQNHLSTLVDDDSEMEATELLLGKLYRHASTLRRINDSEGVVKCIVHPDFVDPNIIEHSPPNTPSAFSGSTEKPATEMHAKWTVVDWANAGFGVRIHSLASLLWTCAPISGSGTYGLVDAVLKGYYASITKEMKLRDEEVSEDVLDPALYGGFLAIRAWDVGLGRMSASEVMEMLEREGGFVEKMGRVAIRVREVVDRLRREGY